MIIIAVFKAVKSYSHFAESSKLHLHGNLIKIPFWITLSFLFRPHKIISSFEIFRSTFVTHCSPLSIHVETSHAANTGHDPQGAVSAS